MLVSKLFWVRTYCNKSHEMGSAVYRVELRNEHGTCTVKVDCNNSVLLLYYFFNQIQQGHLLLTRNVLKMI